MKKLIMILALVGAQNVFADGFTNDWYTTCYPAPSAEEVAEAKKNTITLNGKTYSMTNFMASGVSVFLGKDVTLASFLKKEVLGSECRGLSQGMGFKIFSDAPNPYSELYDQYKDDKEVLAAKALELLRRVNSRSAQQFLN